MIPADHLFPRNTPPLPRTSKPTTPPERRTGTIQSVSIAARFLQALAAAPEAQALGDLARATGTAGSSAHRYLQSLVREGLAQQDPVSGHYDLGPMALGIGIAALKRVDTIEIAAARMKQLVAGHAASGGVAIWTDRGPTLVRWYRSTQFSISSLGLGDILPLDNTACGLAFQAYLPPAQIKAVRKAQPAAFRGTPPAAQTLEAIRKEGIAALSSHLLSDVRGMAVPVFDAQNEITCVMTTVDNIGQTSGAAEREALLRAGREVAGQTGGRQSGSLYKSE